MYLIKQKPEDFVVEEITNVQPQQKGSYTLWWMKKKNLTTIEAITQIANKLGINPKLIGFAGTMTNPFATL